MTFLHLFIASDHAGFDLKKNLMTYLHNSRFASKLIYHDLGPYTVDSVDYPDYAKKVTQSLKTNDQAAGLLICGTGLGMSMAANRFGWVRAAVGNHSLEQVALSRSHNHANVLCLGARLINFSYACSALETFLTTPFAQGRHQERLDKLSKLC